MRMSPRARDPVRTPGITSNGAHCWTPLDCLRLVLSGGAGNRTPVRAWIDHSVYVRSPPIEVSGRWPVGGPLPEKPSRASPRAGRRNVGLSRICDTRQTASGELLVGQVQ